MNEIAREHFYQRLEGAPHAARGFFESIYVHFERDNVAKPHHTDAHGGDLRIAVLGDVLGQRRQRNFATMHWQTNKHVVFARTYLTPNELAVLGFAGATEPKADGEPLNSDIRLGEDVWRHGSKDFIKALEMAKLKFLDVNL